MFRELGSLVLASEQVGTVVVGLAVTTVTKTGKNAKRAKNVQCFEEKNEKKRKKDSFYCVNLYLGEFGFET